MFPLEDAGMHKVNARSTTLSCAFREESKMVAPGEPRPTHLSWSRPSHILISARWIRTTSPAATSSV